MSRSVERMRDREQVLALRAGDQHALGRLFDTSFDRAYDVAHRITRDPDRAAGVAREAFVTAWGRLDELGAPASFGPWLLRIVRDGANDVVRPEGDRQARAGAAWPSGNGKATTGRVDRLVKLDDPGQLTADASLAELVWAAADGLGRRDALVLDLHARHGLEPAEIADVVGAKHAQVAQVVRRAPKRFERALAARMLWDEGTPQCPRLQTVVGGVRSTEFGPDLVAVIDRHARRCNGCRERSRTRLSAMALFAAVPVLAPASLRTRTLAQLSEAGLSMQGAGTPPTTPVAGVARPGRLDLVVGCIALGVLLAFGVLLWAAQDPRSSETVVATESAEKAGVRAQPEVEAVAPPAPSPPSTTRSQGSDAAPETSTETSTTETAPTEDDPTVTDPPQGWTVFPVESVPAQSPFVSPVPIPPRRPPPKSPPPTSPLPPQPPPDVTGPTIADAYQLVDCDGLICLEVLSTSTDLAGIDAMEIYFAVDADPIAVVATCAASPCSWSTPTGYGPGTTLNYLVRARDRAGNWSETPLRTLVL